MSTISPINPASGLPMVDDDIGGLDAAGNPFGTDWSSHDSFSHGSSFDDHSSSFSSSSFDWGGSFGSSWD